MKTTINEKVILVVDDSAVMRNMISVSLHGRGYKIKHAADGQSALAFPKNGRVDLVITDLHMPRVDGIELTRQLRAQSASAKTPILLITTDSTPEKKAAGRAAGATGWITKPFSPNRLQALVEKTLSL